MRRTQFFIVTLLVPVVVLFSGCNQDDGSEEQIAQVMYIHAAPNIGQITIEEPEVGGSVGPFGFGHHSGYVNAYLENVNYRFETYQIASTVLATITSPAWVPNGHYTVVMYQDSAATTGVSLAQFTDELPSVTAGTAGVRFMNFAHDSGELELAVDGQPALFTDIPFYAVQPEAAVTDYIEVPSGSVDLELRSATTSTVVFDHWGFTAQSGALYTVVASGNAGSTLLTGINIQVFENKRD
jgi:hypothetical protein